MRYTALVTDVRFPNYETERALLKTIDAELFVNYEGKPLEDLVGDMDALFVNLSVINRPLIERMNRCKVISRYGIGYDNVDVCACRENGIVVTNVPGYCNESAAEHTLALLLTLHRRVRIHDVRVRNGEWNITKGNPISNFSEQTLGIIGYGEIGSTVHRMTKGFMFKKTLVYTLPSTAEYARAQGAEVVSLERLLKESDALTCHLPLTETTANLLGEREFAMMKKGALFVNTARGGVINEDALVRALREERLAGAGLDVFTKEPLAKTHPLLLFENVVVTDHQAWYSEESIIRLQREAALNVCETLKGNPAPHRV